MKTGRLVMIIVIASLFIVSSAWAECQDGKSEVELTLPNGKVKVMCLPDAALPSLENAADHSDGTIVPTGCPCWDEEDLVYLSKNYLLDWCIKADIAQCYYGKDLISLELNYEQNYCINYITEYKGEKLDIEQYRACFSLLEPYYK